MISTVINPVMPAVGPRAWGQRKFLLPASILVIAGIISLMPLARSLTTPRVFTQDLIGLDTLWLPLRIGMTGTLFGICCIQIGAIAAFRKQVDTAALVLFGTTMMFTAGQLMGSILGQEPDLRLGILTFPLVFGAMLRLQKQHLASFLLVGRYCSLAYILASIALVPVWPDFALQDAYAQYNLIPVRLHGVVSHANQLGGLVGLYVACDVGRSNLTGKPWTLERLLSLGAALGVLVMSQSKTIWLAIAVGFVIMQAVRQWQRRRPLLVLVLIWTIFLAVLAILMVEPGGAWISLDSAESDLTTLTGRTAIWDYVLSLWRQSPWFGYGPRLLIDETQQYELLKHYGFSPSQAHNQWIQSLGEAGLVGLAGLIIHVTVLTLFALRYGAHRMGFSDAYRDLPCPFGNRADAGDILVFRNLPYAFLFCRHADRCQQWDARCHRLT